MQLPAAGFGSRLLAFLIDSVLSDLVALATGHRPGAHDSAYSAIVFGVFLAIELVFVTLAGQTPGMRVAGIAVVRATDGAKPPLRWTAVRTVLLAVIIPALWSDSSGRCLHDRAAGTATVRVRARAR